MDFLRDKLPAYIDTGLNVLDAQDSARGHLLAAEHGRPGERYILGSQNLTLAEILQSVARISRQSPAPMEGALRCRICRRRGRLRHWPISPARSLWPRYEAVKMAAKKMFVSHAKAARELGFRPLPVRRGQARRRVVSSKRVSLKRWRILVVGAEAAELKPFAARLDGLKNVKWPLDYSQEGILGGTRVLVAANGAGPSLAARAVEVAIRAFPASGLSSSRLEAVINAGFCGALISGLRESDIVVGTSVLDKEKGESFDCDLLDCKTSGASSGTIVTQNRIANDSEEKARLSGLGALAVDMEAAGVAARSKRAGIAVLLHQSGVGSSR